MENFSEYFLELQTETGWGRMLASFACWCAPKPGQKVLDVGCGPGLLPSYFSKDGISAFGSDVDPEMFAHPLHPDVLIADIIKMPFREKSFDMITVSNLFYLLPDPFVAMQTIVRILKPEGQLCMLNPSEQMSLAAAEKLAVDSELVGVARESLLGYGQQAEECFRWSEDDLKKIFRDIGLTMTETTLKMGTGLVRYAKGVKKS
ncbi:MAG: class I SAM-dependent methyltransferase [Chloroflexi bacterium]|nr:class I SAM-dependent methyltransferase [Chloroflexota bacterium]MBT3671163.1 class I SAM-dependent methyltransferase [Chloroflexota bacterium]MBT4534397.1 class I SAM-dependent methyltransferase [Chloroflexota bacterium]MBT4682580.1 class I SAM-dependent methyltransferase [Chloroflexota bacterium]MBT4754969.1 class I SAM-dependent methyltransferase [Chloroflexota bacterium]